VRVRQRLLNVAKAILPDRFIEWYRRRRAGRRYIQALGYQVYDREVRLELEDLEGRVAASRAGFTDRLVRDILERTELVIQGLDRKIEGVSARHGRSIRTLQGEMETLRAHAEALRTEVERLSARLAQPERPAPEPPPPTGVPAAVRPE
jgi:chromosome condensin MukBEF ATPase and DNA-binding subunit MukB